MCVPLSGDPSSAPESPLGAPEEKSPSRGSACRRKTRRGRVSARASPSLRAQPPPVSVTTPEAGTGSVESHGGQSGRTSPWTAPGRPRAPCPSGHGLRARQAARLAAEGWGKTRGGCCLPGFTVAVLKSHFLSQFREAGVSVFKCLQLLFRSCESPVFFQGPNYVLLWWRHS